MDVHQLSESRNRDAKSVLASNLYETGAESVWQRTQEQRFNMSKVIRASGFLVVALATAVAPMMAPMTSWAAPSPSDNGVTTQVSMDTTATQDPNKDSTRARISQSGDYIAYQSSAQNLSVPKGVGHRVYFTDLSSSHTIVPTPANHTVLVDVSPITGVKCKGPGGVNGESLFTEVSNAVGGNGPWVVFHSKCVDLVTGWTHSGDVYIKNMRTGVIDVVSRANGNNNAPIAKLSTRPVISDNGRYVAWNDSSGAIYVRDMGDTTPNRSVLVTQPPNGTDDESLRPEISGDGTHVAFASDASLAAADTNTHRDVYEVDLTAWIADHTKKTFTYRPASVNAQGQMAKAHSSRPGINGNGRFVSFESSASNLVSDDRNGALDAYMHDMQSGKTYLISRSYTGAAANSGSSRPQLNDSGYVVAFVSNARNIVPGDDNTRTDSFIRVLNPADPAEGTTYMISKTPTGDAAGSPKVCPLPTAANTPAGKAREGNPDITTRPYLAGSGSRVVVVSGMCNMVSPKTTENRDQIFVRTYPGPAGPNS